MYIWLRGKFFPPRRLARALGSGKAAPLAEQLKLSGKRMVMGYKIKVKDVEGVVHTVETATELAGKTTREIIDIAHKLLTGGGGLAGVLTYLSHEKKDEKPKK